MNKTYYEKNNEYFKNYYLKNKEGKQNSYKNYYEENKEKKRNIIKITKKK